MALETPIVRQSLKCVQKAFNVAEAPAASTPPGNPASENAWPGEGSRSQPKMNCNQFGVRVPKMFQQ